MQKLVKDYLNELKKQRQRRRRAGIAIILLAAIVITGVAGILTQYGVAMTGQVECGLKEHSHDASCYEQVLTCGLLEDGEGHVHGDACYTTEQSLTCLETEGAGHTHSADCYATQETSVLTCALEEGAEHTHEDACYTTESTQVLVCGLEETAPHVHSDACYSETRELSCTIAEGQSHVHSESCYDSVLTCEKEEHVHTDACYAANGTKSLEETIRELFENSTEETAEESEEETTAEETTENKSDWDQLYADTQWQEIWGEDLATAAAAQLGYEESATDYIEEANGSRRGYTRYGAFAGDEYKYARWDAAFVNFCLYYAGLTETELFPAETDSAKWREAFLESQEENASFLTTPEEYQPLKGDIVFFEEEKADGSDVRMGIVSSADMEKNELSVLEGDSDNAVRENTYAINDEAIAGYVEITELETFWKNSAQEMPKEMEAETGDESEAALTEEELAQVEDVIALIEALPSPEEIMEKFMALEEAEDEAGYEAYYRELFKQVSEARAAYEALSEEQQALVTNAQKLQQYEWLESATLEENAPASDIPYFAASIPVEGSDMGRMVLELRYGQDKKHYDELEAQVQSPHWDLIGYFDLYTKDIEGDMTLEDLTVTIHIPKEYIDKESVKFAKIPQNIEHKLSEVTENGDYYEISVTFPQYKQTGQMQYEFDMRFLGGIVPADYDLKIYATISCGEEKADTAENTYRPSYDKPKVVKYVNTNQYDSMAQDYTRVSASVDEDGMISDSGYVSFWYKIGGDSWFFREYDKITLVDTLPTYTKYVTDAEGKIVTDADGNKMTETATAVFNPAENPGWTLSEDGKTVYQVFETTKSCINSSEEDGDDKHWRAATDLKNQVEVAELKLLFPGCVIDEEANDGFLKKDLTNAVDAICHPHNPSAGESDDIVSDDLIFTLTSQPVGAGFAKYNSANVIMDTQTMRSGLYRWGINFENTESVIPLSDIKLTDCELDERLKIRILRLETEGKQEYWAENRIDRVEALTYDDRIITYTASQFNSQKYEYGWGWYQELVLDADEEYKGFTVYMKDGYVLNLGEKIHIGVYTTFREPNKPHYVNDGIKDSPINAYHNGASVDYRVENIFYNMVSGNQFSLIDTNENISIYKQIMYGDQVALGTKEKYWQIEIRGSLSDGKDYEDMRIIDLLPEPFELSKNDQGEQVISFGVGNEFVRERTFIENYKNTGRTAVILDLNVDEIRKVLDASDGENGRCILTLKTEVPEDARVGLFTNEVWLLSDDFETITTQSSAPDIYDLDGDGNKEEEIRVSKAGCTIKAPAGVYAEKFIAPAGSELWRTRDLFLGVGDTFKYKLSVVNAADETHSGLLVYDVLPKIGDRNISNNGGRGSEYTVQLSDRIGPIEGYQVYYTISEKVYEKSMAEILGNTSATAPVAPDPDVVWFREDEVTPDILAQVTAFKIVADEGTVIPAKERAEFVIPAKVTAVLENDSYDILYKKQSADKESGTATYLISTNSFGYYVATFSGSNLESNYVRAQIPFAGFVIRKVDMNATDKPLAGAEFKLEKQTEAASGTDTDAGAEDEKSPDAGNEGASAKNWETIVEKAVSGADGIVSFRDLTEGTYRLTETKAPSGYDAFEGAVIVKIVLNRETMEYEITIDGNDHAGNQKDPFLITNRLQYKLPNTGGIGTGLYKAVGILVMAVSVGSCLYSRKKEKLLYKKKM